MQRTSLENADTFVDSLHSNASPAEKSKTLEKHLTSSSHNQYPRSYVDSQLSTSSESANASPYNRRLAYHHDSTDSALDFSDPNARFPILVQDKISKLKARMRRSEEKPREREVSETPVTEEDAEYEKENMVLKRVPVVEDAEEFNIKSTNINRLRGRDQNLNKEFGRCRSLESSFLPLDCVEEDKDEEELNTFKRRKHLEDLNVEDLNEFNQNQKGERTPTDKKLNRKHSLQFTPQEAILEEQETFIPHLPNMFGSLNTSHGSLHNSPGPRLKVDEIDLKEKKWIKDEDDNEEIEMIMEESEEKNAEQVVDDNKEFQAAKQKLHEEKEFMKKVVIGEMIDQNNTNFAKVSSEFPYVGSGAIEEVIEEDRNENA